MLLPKSIATDRLELRHLREEDLDTLLEFFRNEECCRYLAPGVVYQVLVQGHMPYILAQWITSYSDEFDLNSVSGIAEKGKPSMIGFIGFERRPIDKHPRIIYCLLRRAWGKGYAKEASQAMLRFALDDAKWPRVEAIVDPKNVPSVRVAERVGMRFERMVRDPEFLDEQKLYAIER